MGLIKICIKTGAVKATAHSLRSSSLSPRFHGRTSVHNMQRYWLQLETRLMKAGNEEEKLNESDVRERSILSSPWDRLMARGIERSAISFFRRMIYAARRGQNFYLPLNIEVKAIARFSGRIIKRINLPFSSRERSITRAPYTASRGPRTDD